MQGVPGRSGRPHSRGGDAGRLFNGVKQTGAFRAGLTFVDVESWLEAISNVRLPDPDRTVVLQQRMLAVLLEGIRPGGPALPGKAPTWGEMEARWKPAD